MIDRQQVNLRLDRELISSLDDLASKESVDRTEMARRILVDGIARARIDRAVRDYAAERVTAWKAAEDAGISLYEMLDRIHEAHIPYQLDATELQNTRSDTQAGRRSKVAEAPAAYVSAPASDTESGVEELRERFRPSRVRALFVGESSPAQGTHFYRANSNLFRATRRAFAAVFGEDVVPNGEGFLKFFADQGCWLVDLADRPVNALEEGERRRVVAAGVDRLAATIRATEPASVVTVKRDIVDAVEEAVARADSHADVVSLPFPVRQWTREYEALLEEFVSENIAE
jgi:hypothetical protein